MNLDAAGELSLWLAAAFEAPQPAICTVEFIELGRGAARDCQPDCALPECEALLQAWSQDAESIDERLLSLQREYARLFIGPPRALILPYESCQRGEGRLFGECTLAVQNFYTDSGIRFDGLVCGDAPDHIAAELNALALLCSGQTGHTPAEQNERIQRLRAEHLDQWAPAVSRQILDQSQTPFYRTAAELLLVLLPDRS